MQQRVAYFNQYRVLNMDFAFWGSIRNFQGKYIRYVITRYCSTNGLRITTTHRQSLIKLLDK